MYRASHQEKVGLYLSLKMPGDSGTATFGRFSANRHVNFTELSLSSPRCTSQVESVIRTKAMTSGFSFVGKRLWGRGGM